MIASNLRWASTHLCGPWLHMNFHIWHMLFKLARPVSNQFHPSLSPASSYLAPKVTNLKLRLFSANRPRLYFMELSGLTNEVLRLLLAQNNLAISGSCEQLIKRLGTISPSTSTETRTRSSESSGPRAKRPRSTCQNSGDNNNLDGRRDPALDDALRFPSI